MRIHSESLIRHSREDVFLAYRDHLPEVVPYIPDIKEIIVNSRQETEGGVKLHNIWVAEREVPAFARTFIKPEMLRWDDFAEWKTGEYRCYWTLKVRVMTDAVTCSGTNTITSVDAGTTKVVLDGDLAINLKQIPGVPSLLAGRIAPQVESFIVSLITPNLEGVNKALGSYLDAKKRARG